MAKKLWCLSSWLLIAGTCVSHIAGAQARGNDFEYLRRLEGYWTMKTRLGVYAEKWKRVDDNTWKGRTMRIQGNDSTKVDDMFLFRDGDAIYYTIAAIKDKATGEPVRFRLRVLKRVGFVAENALSPYPQKIKYLWKDDEHMDARFEGKEEKTTREIILQYTKQ